MYFKNAMEINKKLNKGNSYIKYIPKISKELIIDYNKYNQLWDMKPNELGKIKLFGKEINTPRWLQNYGHDYKFSGSNHGSLPIPEILQPLIDWVNNREHEFDYNGILVNWYQDGSHYIGKHSDDESSLVKNSPIYAFSFGTDRDFNIESKPNNNDTKEKHKFKLRDNSLIIMGGECQKYYLHSISKSKKILDSRISVTIRAFKN